MGLGRQYRKLAQRPVVKMGLRLPQLLFQKSINAQALSRYQHLQPQRLRTLVESAVAHLERTRVRNVVANCVHDDLRARRVVPDRQRRVLKRTD